MSADAPAIPEHLATTFVPVDPPRGSWFACWDPAAPGGLLAPDVPGLPTADVELILPEAKGPRPVTVRAARLSMPLAIAYFASLSARTPAHPTTHAWAAIVRSGLALVARGRLLPWVSPDGWDAWRVDPIDHDHLLHVEALALALPSLGHATPHVPRSRSRIADPRFVIRHCWDAVGDRIVRTPAAAKVAASPVFADRNPTRVRHLRPWVRDTAAELCPSTQLVVHMHAPPSASSDWSAVFALQSRLDPSLVVDAVDLWEAGNDLSARFGGQAEIDLLAGVQRAADVSPLFATALGDARPTGVLLADDQLDALLDDLDRLAAAGVDVRWPADILGPSIERRLVVSGSAPDDAMRSLLEMDAILTVDWEFLLEGTRLTSAELAELSESKRAVVPIRGRWIRLDPATRARLSEPPPPLAAGDAMAALLEGEAPVGDGLLDERIPIVARGAVAALIDDIRALGDGASLAPGPGFEATLRPYQARGLRWLSDVCARVGGGCLADDMGLGKTVQVLALHSLRRGPTLVVCPTSVLANWEREAQRFLPGITVRRFHGPNRSLDGVGPGDLVLTTYGVVRTDADALDGASWDLVVADEAQHAKNPRSRTAVELRRITSTCRLALTGTPVENRLSELWAIFDWAVPGLLPSLEEFTRSFAVPIERDGSADATARLHRRITPFLLRRRKSDPDIAPELPPKTERDVVVPLTEEQITLYRATTTETLADIADNDGITRHGLVLKLLTALKQITNHPAHYLDQTGPLPGRSGKLAALDDIVDAALDSAESTLVFTQYVAMGELLAKHLAARGIDTDLLHGGQSIAARTDLVDRFQAGELPVLLLSLRAGGTGLNLTEASHVLHFDRWWNPAVEDQATDRAHRIGQTRPVTVHRLITEGTIEDRVAELLEQKRALADKVVGAGEGWIGNLDDDALRALIELEQ